MINPDVKQINTTALAYMGDAVYEVYIRKHVMETGHVHVDRLHAMAVPFVKAEGQAKAIKYLMDNLLTEEEQALTKRARNHKIATKAKNATPMDYKWATAFEALLGYLHLKGDAERLDEVVAVAIKHIEENTPVRARGSKTTEYKRSLNNE
ncbi:MAG: ribonuclease III [Firmicutes bacterium]|nr:ribonuclease III [Bacillota bacterium]